MCWIFSRSVEVVREGCGAQLASAAASSAMQPVLAATPLLIQDARRGRDAAAATALPCCPRDRETSQNDRTRAPRFRRPPALLPGAPVPALHRDRRRSG